MRKKRDGIMSTFSTGKWVNGLAEWIEGDTAYLSVAFTWRLNEAFSRACWYRQMGLKVRAGGPGIFTRKHFLADVAEIGGDFPDAVMLWRLARHRNRKLSSAEPTGK